MLKLKYIVTVMLALILSACSVATEEPVTVTESAETTEHDSPSGKVVFVDSYHEGYAWSDSIAAGVHNVLDDSNVELLTIHMDTRNNTDTSFRENAGQSAYDEIVAFEADVVIACDDNAQQYLVVPHLKETDIPVVFCGVNSDISEYGYPTDTITGMIEVDLVDQLVTQLQSYTNGTTFGFVTEDVPTEDRVIEVYNANHFNDELQVFKAGTYDEFKEAFLEAQAAVDIVLLGNNAGMSDWDADDAETFFVENTSVPTGSLNPWMSPYVLLTMGKSGEEQGEWAAQSALSILSGESPANIEIVPNEKADITAHLDIAESLDIEFDSALLRNAEIYGRDEAE